LAAARAPASPTVTAVTAAGAPADTTVLAVLFAISFCHLLNDMMQAVLPAIYPMLKEDHGLTFAQIGLITLAFQLTASLLQPLVGLYTDRRPMPYSLAAGMGLTLCGLLLLSRAHSYPLLLLAAALVGTGSSVFHPESSRVARMASGGRPGFAQSLFQVGGNTGSAVGPLLAAFVVIPGGQPSVAWFSLAALLAMAVLWQVGTWYRRRRAASAARAGGGAAVAALPRGRVATSLAILVALMFSKFVYTACLGNYYTFFLIEKFGVSVQTAQFYLFVFLFAMAAGTFFGGPIGDRFGRKWVIWGSILGALPFTLLLPHASLFWTAVLSVAAGLVIASAFSAILVYAQELLPGRVGLVSGLFFGLAFGMGGLGAAALGGLADRIGIEAVFAWCSLLPLIGLLTAFLPDIERRRRA
jgi:MFS transporter, FSR family, fosmidomycin resistance protein